MRVVGVEPEAGDDTRRSLAAGERVRIPVPQTIADGQQLPIPGELTFEVVRRLVAEVVTASDAEIVDAMRFLFERSQDGGRAERRLRAGRAARRRVAADGPAGRRDAQWRQRDRRAVRRARAPVVSRAWPGTSSSSAAGSGGSTPPASSSGCCRTHSAKITLVNDVNFMLYTPLLPGAAGGTIEPRHVVVPLREQLRRTDLRLGRSRGADPDRRSCTCAPPRATTRSYSYDQLVVSLGSVSRTLPIPGLREHALGFKTLSEAIALRNRVVQTLEMAETVDDDAGAGAADLRARGRGLRGRRGPRRDAGLRRRRGRPLPALPHARPPLRPRRGARADHVRDRAVAGRDRDATSCCGAGSRSGRAPPSSGCRPTRWSCPDGEIIPTRTVAWTAGVKPHPVIARLGLPLDEDRADQVDRFCQVEGRSTTCGRSATPPRCPTPHGRASRRRRPASTRSGRGARWRATSPPPSARTASTRSRYKTLGVFVDMGRHQAVAETLGIRWRGFPAWFIARTYHLSQMPGMRPPGAAGRPTGPSACCSAATPPSSASSATRRALGAGLEEHSSGGTTARRPGLGRGRPRRWSGPEVRALAAVVPAPGAPGGDRRRARPRPRRRRPARGVELRWSPTRRTCTPRPRSRWWSGVVRSPRSRCLRGTSTATRSRTCSPQRGAGAGVLRAARGGLRASGPDLRLSDRARGGARAGAGGLRGGCSAPTWAPPQAAGVLAVAAGVLLVRGVARRVTRGPSGSRSASAGASPPTRWSTTRGSRHAAALPYLVVVLALTALPYAAAVAARRGLPALRRAASPRAAVAGLGMVGAYGLTLAALELAEAAPVAALRETGVVMAALAAAALGRDRRRRGGSPARPWSSPGSRRSRSADRRDPLAPGPAPGTRRRCRRPPRPPTARGGRP